MYHLWKHSKKKIVGLEHYRRYFCENDVLLSEARIKEILNEYDAIVAPELHPVNKPLYTHRIKNHPKSFNNIQYFDEYLDICDEKLPGFKKMSIEILSKTNLFYQGNRFVAKKSVIDRYCEFMFSNLDELCKRHPLDASNLRNHGYLTEFTFMIWMEYNNIKTFMVDTILFDRNLNQKVTKPYDKLIERKILTSRISATYSMAAYNGTPIKALDIAFVIDENYAKYLYPTINSLIINNANIRFKFHILGSSKILTSLPELDSIMGNNSYEIKYVNTNIKRNDKIVHTTDSVAPLIKFMIPELFPDLDRILYLDCDLICVGSLDEFCDVQMGSKCVASILDPIAFVPNYENYVPDYFNTGVILFNPKQCIKHSGYDKCIDFHNNHKHHFMDQDTLNYAYKDSKIILDTKYNVLLSTLRQSINGAKELLGVTKSISILHYGGKRKPWNNPDTEYAWYYQFYSK